MFGIHSFFSFFFPLFIQQTFIALSSYNELDKALEKSRHKRYPCPVGNYHPVGVKVSKQVMTGIYKEL